MAYDREDAARFFDAYAEREWTRFEDGRSVPPSLEMHIALLDRVVRPGDRVLDAGAGPGRFTRELARLGARIVAVDVSEFQLELNRATMRDAGSEAAVDAWIAADIADLGVLASDSFDVVVCYGGPLSYLLDQAHAGVAELARVLRPGGRLVASVMSLIGGTTAGLPLVVEDLRRFGPEAVSRVVETGILPAEMSGHLAMRMYRPRELRRLLESHGFEVLGMRASGLGWERIHPETRASLAPEERPLVLAWEVALASDEDAAGMGDHILVEAVKAAE
jgi:SAM-dependent methyltransferase